MTITDFLGCLPVQLLHCYFRLLRHIVGDNSDIAERQSTHVDTFGDQIQQAS